MEKVISMGLTLSVYPYTYSRNCLINHPFGLVSPHAPCMLGSSCLRPIPSESKNGTNSNLNPKPIPPFPTNQGKFTHTLSTEPRDWAYATQVFPWKSRHTRKQQINEHMYIYICIYNVHIYIYMYMYLCMCIHMYIYICVHVCICRCMCMNKKVLGYVARFM